MKYEKRWKCLECSHVTIIVDEVRGYVGEDDYIMKGGKECGHKSFRMIECKRLLVGCVIKCLKCDGLWRTERPMSVKVGDKIKSKCGDCQHESLEVCSMRQPKWLKTDT